MLLLRMQDNGENVYFLPRETTNLATDKSNIKKGIWG